MRSHSVVQADLELMTLLCQPWAWGCTCVPPCWDFVSFWGQVPGQLLYHVSPLLQITKRLTICLKILPGLKEHNPTKRVWLLFFWLHSFSSSGCTDVLASLPLGICLIFNPLFLPSFPGVLRGSLSSSPGSREIFQINLS